MPGCRAPPADRRGRKREAAIRRAVAEGKASSASGYIEKALDALATLESYDELLADWRREVGPPTAEEQAWAREVVGAAAAQTRRAG